MAINLKGYRITVLCEDLAQYDFIYAYAKLLGAEPRKIIRDNKAFNNSTVLQYYSKAVESYRKFSRENIILIAMLDADEKTIQESFREFDKQLDFEKFKLNQDTRFDEKILLFIPIRNIESWFHYIITGATDVEILKDNNGKVISYKSQYTNKKLITSYAEKLKNEICINGLPENAPSSLHHACNELNRLKN